MTWKTFTAWLWEPRLWLLRLLAGKSTIVMNCDVTGYILTRGQHGYLHNLNLRGSGSFVEAITVGPSKSCFTGVMETAISRHDRRSP